jgi:hypothetical protein
MDGAGDGYGYRAESYGHPHFIVHTIFLLLILLVCGAIGVAVGRMMARRDELERRALAREAIYNDVRKAIERALKAQGADLINAAQHLLDKVRSRIGAASTLHKALSGPSDAITKAIAGKITDPPKPAPPPAPPPPAKAQPTTVIVNPPSLITRINVIEPEPKEKPAEKPPEPEKPQERDMTLKEQLNALRLAVESFSAAWERGAVDTMLKDLQTAVLDARSSRDEPKP